MEPVFMSLTLITPNRPLAYGVTNPNSALSEVSEDLSFAESGAQRVHMFTFPLFDSGG